MSILDRFMARLGFVRLAPYGLVLTPQGIYSTRPESQDLLVGWIDGADDAVKAMVDDGEWERIIARAHLALADEHASPKREAVGPPEARVVRDFSVQDVTQVVADMEQVAWAASGRDVLKIEVTDEQDDRPAPGMPPRRTTARTVARQPSVVSMLPQPPAQRAATATGTRRLARGSAAGIPQGVPGMMFADEVPTGIDSAVGARRRQARDGDASE